jgi:hypothetical protein
MRPAASAGQPVREPARTALTTCSVSLRQPSPSLLST